MRWPLVPVILASGHARERVGELRPGAVYMPKSWQPLNVLIAAERPWHLGWDAPALDHSRQAIAGITLSFHRETANSSREFVALLYTGHGQFETIGSMCWSWRRLRHVTDAVCNPDVDLLGFAHQSRSFDVVVQRDNESGRGAGEATRHHQDGIDRQF